MGAAEATGKGIKLTLDGKEYSLSPIDVDDLAEFESHMKSENLKACMAAAEQMPADQRKEIIKTALSMTMSDLMEGLRTPLGIRFLLYRSLLPNHPELTLKDVGKLLSTVNLDEISTILGNMYGEEAGPLEQEAAGSQ